MRQRPERIVLVTGASHGIGAEAALRFAEPGTHVAVNHRDDPEHAARVADAVRDAGGQACTIAADISDETATTAMIDAVRAHFGRLDALVLNACCCDVPAGGPGEAMRLNRDAQHRLATLAMPLMPAGARIVYVTTHQAHFFPDKAVPMGYAAVAAGQRAGETALYAMRPDFDHAGIGFTVVSGKMIADATHDAAEDARVAAAVVEATAAQPVPGIVYVGGADYLMTA